MVTAPKKLAETRVGTLFDAKWTLDSMLGHGGSAAVYAATHRNGKRAAIKILHAHCAADPHLVSRFIREGYLANKIEHPGVVSILDDDKTEDGSVYLVMELLDGVSLDKHGRGLAPPLEVADALKIADDLLSILVAAHAKGLVHRDIKPANLFLTTAGELKILDFGIARLAEGIGEGQATQTGMLMGTPAFMPPEQARGRWHDVDARSDIWAVGATLMALMIGRRPRIAETGAEELLAAMTAPLPSLATLVPGAPAGLVELVDRAVAFDRDARWPSAVAMQTATREVAKALETTPFRASTTVAIAHSRSSFSDATPQPLLPNVPYPSNMFAPHGAAPHSGPVPASGLSEPDLAPSHTTNRGYMRSNAPPAPPVPRSATGAVGALIAVSLIVGVSAMVGGVLYMRSREPKPAVSLPLQAPPESPPPVAAAAEPATPPAAIAPQAATATVGATAGATTAPTATTQTTTATAIPTAIPTATATSPATPAGPSPGSHAAKPGAHPPRPKAAGDGGAGDPNKFMDTRF